MRNLTEGSWVKLAMIVMIAGSGVVNARGPVARSWEEAESRLKPVTQDGPVAKPELRGKVVAGYQGWFGAEGDGSGVGWRHYGGEGLGPGFCSFEMWPAMDEMGKGEKFPSLFKYDDGSPASLFSSYVSDTVDRHFKWMAEYGIDGVMLQRFGANLRRPEDFDFCTAVMDNVRNAAVKHDRSWGVMYDLSGMKKEELLPLIKEDWKRLVRLGKVTEDSVYLHHHGKPLVAIWGIGFSDGRDYGLAECGELIDFLKGDPEFGGNSVMLGIPYFWRDGERDAVPGEELEAVLKKADILSPWAVGRYRGSDEVGKILPERIKGDLNWCKSEDMAYLPVIFPGFSWHNLQKNRGVDAPLNAIDREDGKFLWRQAIEAKKAGSEMIYIAMFDELDEATAILKVSERVPVGESPFVSYGDLPEDHYLWLSGEIGRMLRGEIPPGKGLPER